MRTLPQPGPAPKERIETHIGHGRALSFQLQPDLTLTEALTGPLVAQGFKAGALTFSGGTLSPFRCVMPGPPRDPNHVAWFSDPRSPPAAHIEIANATFGWRDGKPFVHCHAAWTEPDGSRRGGHILPDETIVAKPTTADAWAVSDVTIQTDADPETNFSLFHPIPTGTAPGQPFILARLRPNQDLAGALRLLCRRHGCTSATTRGCVGSLIGATFTEGATVPDYATEVLIHSGTISPESAELRLLVADMQGAIHEGTLAGPNAVCITFEVMLEPLHP